MRTISNAYVRLKTGLNIPDATEASHSSICSGKALCCSCATDRVTHNGDADELEVCSTCHKYILRGYAPKTITLPIVRKFELLRSLAALCGDVVWKRALDRLTFIRNSFAKSLATLNMEQRNAQLVAPNAGLLTFGGNVQMNFAIEE